MKQNILSIILYGSYARNDQDATSDYDVCVLTESRRGYELDSNELKSLIEVPKNYQLKPVFYYASVVDLMIENGSLFLWHLKLEGKVLYGKGHFDKIIKNLKPFRCHHEEIMYHAMLFDDLIQSKEYIHQPNELDLSLLFTISRNTCMILSHKKGEPSFGRYNSYTTAKRLFPDLSLKLDDYLFLSTWKIVYERGSNKEHILPRNEQFKTILYNIGKLLRYAEDKTK